MVKHLGLPSGIPAKIEHQVDANLKRAARLRQGILKRAFEGRLVPQHPTDEAADKVLERIKHERKQRLNPLPIQTRFGRGRKSASSDDESASF